MTAGERIFKQLAYLTIFLALAGAVFFLFYQYSGETPEITPTPVLIAPIEVQFTAPIRVKNFDYDIVAKIRNPNSDLGSSAVSYGLKFFNQNNQVFETRTGETYILPGQDRFIVESPVRLNQELFKVELVILEVKWEKLNTIFQENVSLVTVNHDLVFNQSPGVFASLNGIILNSSDFDLDQTEILGILYNQSGGIAATGKTNIRTFLAHTERAFEIRWFDEFQNNIGKIEVQAHSNLLENSNFLRRFGERERFQEF